MTVNQMLRDLGYTTSPAGVSKFQRDYNLLGSSPVLVTGELDEDTRAAVHFAHGAKVVFMSVLGRRRS